MRYLGSVIDDTADLATPEGAAAMDVFDGGAAVLVSMTDVQAAITRACYAEWARMAGSLTSGSVTSASPRPSS